MIGGKGAALSGVSESTAVVADIAEPSLIDQRWTEDVDIRYDRLLTVVDGV